MSEHNGKRVKRQKKDKGKVGSEEMEEEKGSVEQKKGTVMRL